MEPREEIKRYIAENFLPADERSALDDATPLVSSGLIDSVGMIALMNFLEGRFSVEFMPREVDAGSLDTIERIERLIRAKLDS